MKGLTARRKTNQGKIGKLPVVILPLEDYERMVEDLEMFRSRALPREIRQAREEVKQGRVLTLAEVKQKLKLT